MTTARLTVEACLKFNTTEQWEKKEKEIKQMTREFRAYAINPVIQHEDEKKFAQEIKDSLQATGEFPREMQLERMRRVDGVAVMPVVIEILKEIREDNESIFFKELHAITPVDLKKNYKKASLGLIIEAIIGSTIKSRFETLVNNTEIKDLTTQKVKDLLDEIVNVVLKNLKARGWYGNVPFQNKEADLRELLITQLYLECSMILYHELDKRQLLSGAWLRVAMAPYLMNKKSLQTPFIAIAEAAKFIHVSNKSLNLAEELRNWLDALYLRSFFQIQNNHRSGGELLLDEEKGIYRVPPVVNRLGDGSLPRVNTKDEQLFGNFNLTLIQLAEYHRRAAQSLKMSLSPRTENAAKLPPVIADAPPEKGKSLADLGLREIPPDENKQDDKRPEQLTVSPEFASQEQKEKERSDAGSTLTLVPIPSTPKEPPRECPKGEKIEGLRDVYKRTNTYGDIEFFCKVPPNQAQDVEKILVKALTQKEVVDDKEFCSRLREFHPENDDDAIRRKLGLLKEIVQFKLTGEQYNSIFTALMQAKKVSQDYILGAKKMFGRMYGYKSRRHDPEAKLIKNSFLENISDINDSREAGIRKMTSILLICIQVTEGLMNEPSNIKSDELLPGMTEVINNVYESVLRSIHLTPAAKQA